MSVIKPDSFPSRGMFGLSDVLDYTNFEKCICLKGSQLMKNLDDDKVSLVAQLSRVTTLNHGDTLYVDGAAADNIYVIIDGTITITQQLPNGEATIQLHDGDCFGEEVGHAEFVFVFILFLLLTSCIRWRLYAIVCSLSFRTQTSTEMQWQSDA